jgi:hypothetical protein
MLLFESGIEIHTTDFQWPKNPAPPGFSMKQYKNIISKYNLFFRSFHV